MKIEKAKWTTDGDSYAMGMSISKVDKENRLVHGWASLDNEDLQGDRVTAEASQRAFSKFRGNIREMHQPIAVGRMVSYKPETYYDENGKAYNGVFVTAYVSKGAQSTWEKVLDGTLQAFSIKGPIRDSEMEFSKDSNRSIRIIKDYELEELSLVDAGGNQLANIVSIEKSATGTKVSGTMTEMKSENVFWCKEDELAKTSSEDALECPLGHKMENIGWFEYDTNDRAEKLAGVVAQYLEKGTEQSEGGVDMSKENEGAVEAEATLENAEALADGEEKVEGAQEAEATTENAAELAQEEEKVEGAQEAKITEENAADVSEVEEESISKMLDDLKESINKSLEKNAVAAQEQQANFDAKLGDLEKRLEEKVSELAKAGDDLKSKVESVKTQIAEMEKSLGTVSKATAVKKSGDLGGSSEETLEKSKGSMWGGHFLSVDSLD